MSPRLPWWAVWLPPLASAYVFAVLVGTGALHADVLTWALLVLSVLSALLPRAIAEGEDEPGAGLLAALAAVVSLLAIAVSVPARSLLLEVLGAALPAVEGALVLWLALEAPEPPRALARLNGLAIALTLVAVVAAVLGGLVYVAPFDLFGETVVLPGALVELPVGVLLAALAIALVLRLVRGRLGAGPAELAKSSYAVLGTSTALVTWLISGVAARMLEGDLALDVLRAGMLLAQLALLLGHLAMVRGGRALDPTRAAEVTRAALAAIVTVALAVVALVLFRDRAERLDAVGLALAGASFLGLTFALHRLVVAAVTWLVAPDRGRLLEAVRDVKAELVAARSLDELGQQLLPRLARATRSTGDGPLLLLATPPLEVSVDAAGMPHVRVAEPSPALFARLAERPGEVLLRAPLEALVVRRPELRPLTSALERLDALAVVALVTLGELEGALVIPRGARRSPVTLEEIAALNSLGARLSGLVGVLTAERRAQDRLGAAVLDAETKAERIEALQEELAELRADAAALKAGAQLDRFSQPVIAYGPSMRAFVRRAEEVAPLDGPVLVRAEAGTALEPIGHLLHAGSARKDGPLVVADALSLTEGRASAALFGTSEGEPHPGWLKLAQGGTLLLLDVPALPLAVQSALEEAIASRSFRPVGGASSIALDARVVMTSRVDLAERVLAGSFDAELAKRVEPLTLVLPSLAARREDLRSLVLVAIDRGCRALGKPTVGIEDDALRALGGHSFSEGTRELESIVERAVARARGPRITLADLELVAAASSAGTVTAEPASEGDAWVGSYTELETRILEKALERANGNKSEAARALGLKRTTFLDKLRRAGLERPTSPPPSPDPEA